MYVTIIGMHSRLTRGLKSLISDTHCLSEFDDKPSGDALSDRPDIKWTCMYMYIHVHVGASHGRAATHRYPMPVIC